MDLSIVGERDSAGRHVLHLAGALDLSSRTALVDAGTDALTGERPTGLVLELGEIGFFDSSGIGAVVQLAGDAEDAGIGFALQRPSERVIRVLKIAGLLDAWPIENITGQDVTGSE